MTKAKPKNEIANIDAGKQALQAVQSLSGELRAVIDNGDEIERAVAIATGVVQLHDALTDDATALLMRLQGHELGFKTDRDQNGGYSAAEVKQIAVRALLHGARLTGNEMNIIASGCYLTQQFYTRKLREYDGLTDLAIEVDAPTDPTKRDKMTRYRVGGSASCKIDGVPVKLLFRKNQHRDNRAIVEVYDNGTAIDGAIGKAKKRFAQQLYERIAGVEITDDEAATVVVLDPNEQPADDIANQNAAGEESQEQPPETVRDWKTEFEQFGVLAQGQLLRDAPNKTERDKVLTAACSQKAANKITSDGYTVLQEYAVHLNT